MSRGMLSWRKLPTGSLYKYDPSSHLMTMDHGLHQLGLCRACEKLDWQAAASTDGFVLRKNHWEIFTTQWKCRLCAFIAKTFRDIRHYENAIAIMGLPRNVQLPVRLNLRGSRLDVTLDGMRLDGVLQPGPHASFELFSEPGSNLAKLGMPEVVGRQKNDLSEDLENIIPQCCRRMLQVQHGMENQLAPHLPSRVLDLALGLSYDSDAPIRLHLATGTERAGYVALSHRWGLRSSKQQMPSWTTLGNISQQCAQIDLHSLPRTFQDAVAVTRMLGFRYLWIDALCIVQDDPNDWRLQSARMGSIFMHANVTLAAHSARNFEEGFLWRREVPEYLSIRPRKYRDALRTTVYTRIPKLRDEVIIERLVGSEISRRAWCVQELCLSKTILHFVEDAMLWECPHRTIFPTPAQLLRSSGSSRRGLQGWLYMVQDYSSCHLTNSDDKLAAIAGLARIWPMQRDSASTRSYHFGVWGDDLPRCLLWMEEEGDGKNVMVRRQGRAPTWSWASVDGKIRFFPRLNPDAEATGDIDGISFDYRGQPPMSDRFLGGRCSLRFRTTVVEGLRIIKFRLHLWRPSPCVPRFPALYAGSKAVGWARLDAHFHNRRGSPKVDCIRVMSEWLAGKQYCYVLIAKKDERGEYLRLGMGCIDQTEMFDGISPRVISIC